MQKSAELAWGRLAMALAPALLLCGGCARDAILKPAATSFVADSRDAITKVDTLYTGVIAELNEQNVRFLADHPECGLNTDLTLRTPESDRILGRTDTAATGDIACLTRADIDAIDASTASEAEQEAALSRRLRLVVLSPADFTLRTAVVRQLTEYVAALADAADAPEQTAAEEIKSLGAGVLALSEAAEKLRSAIDPKGSSDLTRLIAADGPIRKFVDNLAALGGAIEVVADAAHDVRLLRRAIGGEAGDQISSRLRALAGDADRWSCIQAVATRGRLQADADRTRGEFATLPRERREAAARSYLETAAKPIDPRCGLAEGPSFTTVGLMLDALAKANDDLARIARGDLTAEERRREAAVTMQRLGAIFNAFASLALVVL